MKIKILFQTDDCKTRESRVFIGVFDADELLEEAIEERGLREGDEEYFDIIEAYLNAY